MLSFLCPTIGIWRTRLAELHNRLRITVLSVLFYYYPSVLTTILSLFACYRIDPATPASDELYPQFAKVRILVTTSLLVCWISFIVVVSNME